MGWRTAPLPPGWDRMRAETFAADGYQCRMILPDGTRCLGPAEECDHIGDPNDHSPQNRRSLCGWHHRKRTSAQANAARKRVTQQRPKEKHPGIM